jgi:long-chain acyl-CoA synthetase
MTASAQTFPQLLLQHAKERPNAVAMREKEYGIWQVLTWSEIASLVRSLAAGLGAAGLSRGSTSS